MPVHPGPIADDDPGREVWIICDKNEPSRFLGEGVSFKAKLIGILEVSEARGDRMCQEALADLKMAIRAAGEHKQRININIAIDGLRLRDEKTGDCLYHHPVHKISFIAQDMSDSRAFGYIFGSPDTGHRFFGIKTDKAASQVVIAMRDLFQVVFELKKKEIELAKQHIEQHQIKLGGGLFVDSGSSSKNGGGTSEQMTSKMRTIQEDTVKENGSTKPSQQTSEVIADLLDLEFELNSIQQGIHQMERITPSDPFGPSTTKEDPFASDPFGDSFAPPSTIFPPAKPAKQQQQQQQPVAILPPPPSAKDSSRSSRDPFNVPSAARHSSQRTTARTPPAAAASASAVTSISKPSPPVQPAPVQQQEKHWFDQETESLFDEGELVTPPLPSGTNVQSFTTIPPPVDQQDTRASPRPPSQQQSANQFDVFTELDPLGTGRSKPYIDRKDFFQELKNPPKKVLKDLVTEAPAEATAPLFQATFESGSNLSASNSVTCPSSTDVVLSSVESASTNAVGTSIVTTSTTGVITNVNAVSIDADPFKDTDPFDKTDPFAEDDFSQLGAFPPPGTSSDPFDTEFADFTMFGRNGKPTVSSVIEGSTAASQDDDAKRTSPSMQHDAVPSTFHGPLRVSLPPEKAPTELYVPLPPLPTSGQASTTHTGLSATLSKTKNKSRLHKQTTVTGLVKLPSPKSSQRTSGRLMKQMTVDSFSGGSPSQPPRLSPTPPMPPTPSRSGRRSPASQNILESVTLRNRCAITPSPPIVACFPDMTESDNTSRLSGSSAELAEIAPEPPPRPATNITPIKPPPLPPKRQQVGNVMKPPPRPPHMEDHPHYDYIENYETSSSPTPQETEEIKSPPIPVPARRPRFGEADHGSIPQRPRRQYPAAVMTLQTTSEPDYVPPFPLLPPPQKKSPASDASKTYPSSKSRSPAVTTIESFLQSTSSLTTTPASEDQHGKMQQSSATSLDITLSQLTKTGLSDLAAILGVSPGHLSNMTLQDLTKCLSKLSEIKETSESATDDSKFESGIKRDKYATLRESVDEEPEFKAEFEAHFEASEPSEKLEDVFQEAPFDKYAVFRELIEQEEKVSEPADGPTSPVDAELKPADSKQAESKQLETISETIVEDISEEKKAEDRYAALREISLDSATTEKDDADTSSEKDESATDAVKADEDYDLLSLSRQQSDRADSPAVEVTPVREPQSIIETTILEEDVNALEGEEDTQTELPQLTEELDKVQPSPEVLPTGKKEDSEGTQAATPPKVVSGPSPPQKEEIERDLCKEGKRKEEETTPSNEGWAKFESGHVTSEKPVSEAPSEGGISPWSSDGKEFKVHPSPTQEPSEREEKGKRRRVRRPAHWREDDESEEGWEDRRAEEGPWKERPWRENGWSDGESFYDDAPPYVERMYQDERRGRRRRVSPWRRGPRSSRDVSPWEQEGKDDDEENWGGPSKRWPERSMDEEEEEEYEVSWRTRPRHRGSSWDDEKQRRYGSRDVNGLEYEDGWKRRPSPWGGEGDRRSSFESVSWDEDDRFSQREYGDRRVRGDREEEYRWRREPEMDSRYAWGRKCVGVDGEYVWHEQAPRRKHRYYRDRSRESPWEDEFSEQGEEESPRYQGRKRTWPKRPSSASEARWPPEKSSPGDYKPRVAEKQQHSLPAMPRPENLEKATGYGFTERRYREKGGARPRSREGYFNSDQEYDYWPHQERSRRTEREFSYEQRSQTLHTRRPQRYKKPQDRPCNQKSPFDDDFSMQAFEFNADAKDQPELDASEVFKKKSPVLSGHSTTLPGIPTPIDTLPKPKDRLTTDTEAKPKELTLRSPLDQNESPPQDDSSKPRTSRGSSHRQSPFEDDFTPPETRHPSARLASSISSDISDHRRSPYEDIRSSCRVESVAEESESAIDKVISKSSDDVFLPADDGNEPVHTGGETVFADFENGAFADSVSDLPLSAKAFLESKRVERRVPGSLWNGEEISKTEKHHPGMKVRMSSLLRVDSSSSLRKSESINIFARESDPFDDDFFSAESATLPRPKSDQGARTAEKSGNSNSSDPFKWTKAFESFNFEEEK
ncbi:protein disabled [Anabrus simplex]|uniref:protein disabled n=1 Tax=Anabrus simplex TaxID=316456 RepID=UPI0035A376EB